MVDTDFKTRLLSLLPFDDAAADQSRRHVGLEEPEDIDARNFVLDEAFEFIHWAVDGKKVIIRCKHCRVLFEVLDVEPEIDDLAGSGVVEITYVPDMINGDGLSRVGVNAVLVFRVYRTFLKPLGKKLRSHPECQITFSRGL